MESQIEKDIITVHLPRQLKEQARAIAQRKAETLSTVVRDLIRRGVELETRSGDR
jgi:hypothetical protein